MKRAGLVIAGCVVIAAAAFNSTLAYDDVYLVDFFRLLRDQHGVGGAAWFLFIGTDLGSDQFRTYGLSRVIHFLLWFAFGTHAAAWAAFIAAAQLVSATGIYLLAIGAGVDRMRAAASALVWALSPFAATSCFHHWSYTLLPAELAIAGALAWQRGHIVIACVLAAAAALSGEAYVFVPALYVIVALASDRRRLTALWPIGSFLAALGAYRIAWAAAMASRPSAHPRFALAAPTVDRLVTHSEHFARIIVTGVTAQIEPIITAAGAGGTALAFVGIVLCAVVAARTGRTEDVGRSFALPCALLVLSLAAVAMVAAVTIFSDYVGGPLPRRHGAVAYTLTAMAVVALLASPAVRRRAGFVPATAAVASIAWLWAVLELVALPTIRAQDAQLWAPAVAQLPDRPNILFPVGEITDAVSGGLRGEVPEIFETPLSAYAWQSQYAVVVLGAHDVGFRVEGGGPAVELVGSGLLRARMAAVDAARILVVSSPTRASWPRLPTIEVRPLASLPPPDSPAPAGPSPR